MDREEKLNQLTLPHSKLFFIITQLFKENKIRKNQRVVLKEMVITGDPNIFSLLQEYEQEKDMDCLEEGLLRFCSRQPVQETPPMQSLLKQHEKTPPNNEGGGSKLGDITSPIGDSLIQIKRRKGQKQNVDNYMKEAENRGKPQQPKKRASPPQSKPDEPQDEAPKLGGFLMKCDIGKSPEMLRRGIDESLKQGGLGGGGYS